MAEKALELAKIDWKKIDWKKNIKTNMSFLLLNIDSVALEGHMKSNHVLLPLTIRRIWGHKDETSRISQLLEQILIGDETRLTSFCKALQGSGQSHIVTNYIEKIHHPEDVTDATPVQQCLSRGLCISSSERDQLYQQWNLVVEQLESPNVFVDSLQTKDVLTQLQAKKLKDMNCEAERNEAILNYMERTSAYNYKMFRCVLREFRQEHIAQLLEVTSQIEQPSASTFENERTRASCDEHSQKRNTTCSNAAVQETSTGPSEETFQFNQHDQTFVKSEVDDIETTKMRDAEQCRTADLESESHVSSPFQCEDDQLNIPECPTDDANAVALNSSSTIASENVVISFTEASRLELPQPPAESFATRCQPNFNDDYTIIIKGQKVTTQKIRDVEERIRNSDAYMTVCNAASGTHRFALVINNEHFTDSRLSTRDGTQVDVENLRNLFTYLNFKIKVLENLTAEQIGAVCQKESRDPSRQQNSVFVCCVLSHGSTGTVKGVDGVDVKLDDIYNLFDGKNCGFLRGKPKIFMIQACQGDQMSKGVPSDDAPDCRSSMPGTVDDAPVRPNLSDAVTNNGKDDKRKHEKADMAFLMATFTGYVAWRSGTKGSYFVQHITQVFSQYAHEEHFADMVPKVMNLMNHSKMDKGYKQICDFRTTLDKKLYLLPNV